MRGRTRSKASKAPESGAGARRPPSAARRALAWLPWPLRWAIFGIVYLGPPAAAALAAVVLYHVYSLPDPLSLIHKDRAPVVRVLDRAGSEIATRGAAHDYMPLALLPRHVQDAVVATEDRRFYDHFGVDPAGLFRAVLANLRAGRFVQGGSTLTQQLAKNLFLSPERTLARKFDEMALALWLEVRLAKEDILELYLNRVYFGGGAYGIEAAAQRYFGKSARRLTLAEAAILAGLLKAPSKYAPTASPGLARSRGRLVLEQMADAGFITPEERASALDQRIAFAGRRHDATGAGYAVDFVLERMPPLVRSGISEIVVETTLDGKLQRRAQAIVEDYLERRSGALDVEQAAVVALGPEGDIRALVGGRDYAENGFNRAVKALRQPGSAFKPIVYLTALESGLAPDSTVYDLPVTVAGWAPRNDNGEYVGALPMRQALARSLNAVSVRLLLGAGAGRVVATARRLGITSDLGKEASLALGTSEVSLLELTGAYGVLAAGGRASELHVIERVRTGTGDVLYTRKPVPPRQAVAPEHAAEMSDMLSGVITSGTGRGAALPGRPAAGKTGTTQDFRDAWFIGYTAHLTVGVWVGNDLPRPMQRVTGGSLPAEIWREVMLFAHKSKPPLPLGAKEPPTPAPNAQPRAEETVELHPNEGIGADFIARAVSSVRREPVAAAPAGRVERQPLRPIPRDYMSLGGPPAAVWPR